MIIREVGRLPYFLPGWVSLLVKPTCNFISACDIVSQCDRRWLVKMASSTGYGPSGSKTRWDHLHFNGNEREYDMWEIRMLAYLKLKGLKSTVLPVSEGGDNEFEVDPEKDETAFSELIQFLDKRSLGLVCRDGVNSGRKSLKILHAHYAGCGKPRVMVLYTQLSSLEIGPKEDVTDYIIITLLL